METIFVLLLVGIGCGAITNSMNKAKGYDGGWCWGIFLGVIGIIIVAVRPFNQHGGTNE